MNFLYRYKNILILVAFWLLALAFIGSVSPSFSTYGPKKCGDRSYPSYYRWDSAWYTQIAERGYNFSEIKNSSIAYWPLFPFTIKILHSLRVVPIGYTSTVLSVTYTLLAILMLWKLARLDYDEKVSFNILLVFLLFPSAYFLVSGYPEALFVLLTISSLYFARKRAWAKAGISGALLALTKPYGFLIIAALAWEYLESIDWQWKKIFSSRKWFLIFMPLLSVAGYMFFNWKRFGNPLAFLVAEKTWGRSIGNPFLALFLEAKDYLNPPAKLLTGAGFPYIIYVLSFFFFLWAMAVSYKRVRTSYLIFTGLSMLTAFMTGTLTSWDRYMMISIASLIGVAVYFSEKKHCLWIYLLTSGSLLVLLASLFVRCYPVE